MYASKLIYEEVGSHAPIIIILLLLLIIIIIIIYHYKYSTYTTLYICILSVWRVPCLNVSRNTVCKKSIVAVRIGFDFDSILS